MRLRIINFRPFPLPTAVAYSLILPWTFPLADCGPESNGQECWMPNVAIEFSHASHAKPGWPEFCPGDPPRVEHYLSYTVTSHSNSSQNEENPNWPGESTSEAGWSKTWLSGYRKLNLTSSYDATESIAIDGQTEA